ncbi:hypothetical protein TNCV_3531881 [Trichonephila clavipes]|nr:hypothetical protein TNCV_3531881 [Trichonephila clavipes]
MLRTRQGEPPLAQPESEKFNLIELIPMYDGRGSLGIRRFLGKIKDVADLGVGHRQAECRKRIAEQRPWNSPRFRRSVRDETPVSRSSRIQPVNHGRVRFEDATPRRFPSGNSPLGRPGAFCKHQSCKRNIVSTFPNVEIL